MKTLSAAPEDEGGFDLDLFGLELDHWIDTRIKPEIKTALERRQALFDEALRRHPKSAAERERRERERADFARRQERRRYVASGAAAQAAAQQTTTRPSNVRALAENLARQWKAPFVLDPRLRKHPARSA